MNLTRTKREYTIIIEKDSEGYLIASVPELPGCHTQARSWDQLQERIKEAIELYLDENDDPSEVNQFVGVQRIAV
ncbi:MAG: type II toxin-antitoxin system HicB family antitoxin [Bacteroidales bacterium]